MFEAVDQNFDCLVNHASSLARGIDKGNTTSFKAPAHGTQVGPSIATVLKAGFRARVMSYHSAYELGAKNGLSLMDLRDRTEQCATLIRAGLTHAVDESVFAALVFNHPTLARSLARELARSGR
ncbi:hypothetical protein [uncultured Cohaesibacter sp.]|uniref:hypothetical protein n=1 Tax=uncultured Cohaesibacter sp. TaxID=1002546 RepID=UPI0029309072|nr:hypothetical protein [uncultured Cohaesibacter sp.]